MYQNQSLYNTPDQYQQNRPNPQSLYNTPDQYQQNRSNPQSLYDTKPNPPNNSYTIDIAPVGPSFGAEQRPPLPQNNYPGYSPVSPYGPQQGLISPSMVSPGVPSPGIESPGSNYIYQNPQSGQFQPFGAGSPSLSIPPQNVPLGRPADLTPRYDASLSPGYQKPVGFGAPPPISPQPYSPASPYNMNYGQPPVANAPPPAMAPPVGAPSAQPNFNNPPSQYYNYYS